MRSFTSALVVVIAACGGGEDPASPDSDLPGDAAVGCRAPAAADRTRYVVVTHPYTEAGDRADVYEVLELSEAGVLARFSPPRTFLMDRTTFGVMAFTPDGEIGFVATENGTLGVFRLDAQGMPTVIERGLAGEFYASDVVVAPDGESVFVVDRNTVENGGGVFRLAIDCTSGAVGSPVKVFAADFPGAFVLMPGDPLRAIVAARSVYDGTPAGEDVHHVLLDGDPPGRIAGFDVFGMQDAIVVGAAVTHDGQFFLGGDTNFGRIGVAAIEDGAVSRATMISPFSDPQGIVTSPFGHVAIATSTLDADEIHVIDRDGTGAWRDAGEVAYKDGVSPQLPGDVVMVSRGTLAGHVIVSENVAIRQLAFQPSGAVVDLALVTFDGGGLDEINGAIGVTP